MVRERSDGKWSLPGGWADIGLSPCEVAIKEVVEESGLEVKPIKLLGVFDKKCHPHPPSPYHVYKMFIQCEKIGGQLKKSVETDAIAFFSENELPPLSVERNTESQIKKMFQLVNNQDLVYCD